MMGGLSHLEENREHRQVLEAAGDFLRDIVAQVRHQLVEARIARQPGKEAPEHPLLFETHLFCSQGRPSGGGVVSGWGSASRPLI